MKSPDQVGVGWEVAVPIKEAGAGPWALHVFERNDQYHACPQCHRKLQTADVEARKCPRCGYSPDPPALPAGVEPGQPSSPSPS